MKRFLPVVTVIFLFLITQLLNYSITFSQDFTFDRAYQDYIYNFNLYRDSHLKYISSRGEYLTYKTLNAETKALEATREMLQKRAEALRTYLTALRLKLVETTGVTNYQQNLVFVKLDIEVGWLTTHRDSLTSPATLSDLVKVSSTLEERNSILEVLIYQALGTILSGKENALRDQTESQAQKTEETISRMKDAGETVDKLERWQLEARKKITLSAQKQSEAETKIRAIEKSDTDKQEEFNKAQFAYEEANQYLKEATSFLKEITEEIKYE